MAPIASAIRVARAGVASMWVTVATMTAPSWAGSTPATSSALRAASSVMPASV